MNEITLIFPDQLYEFHPALTISVPVVLAEEYLYFKIQPFHKQRLILLRAAMKTYANFLIQKGFKVHYLESSLFNKRGDLFTYLSKMGVKKIHLTSFTDHWLEQDLLKANRNHPWDIKKYDSPNFLSIESELRSCFANKTHYSMASFYAFQRKKLNLLMYKERPLGGKFSFDKENRKKIPKNIIIPKYEIPKQDSIIKEAVEYVSHNFPNAIGNGNVLYYPINFIDAKNRLHDFIENKLQYFGDYQDAIVKNQSFLFHSILSPMLNLGLINPSDIINTAISYAAERAVPLNSLEGFLRQIIGWREFMRATYILKGISQRSSNYFGHKNPLPKGFWNGTTGIEPIDATIIKTLNTGYCHHIERLMVLGNFLLLLETDPNEVYNWFMSYFVDAYDWVMVPNIYGMSQFADNGLITTKPYISGSNYILKMSDYTKGTWGDIWDGLFWRFLKKHTSYFEQNPRMKVLLKHLYNKPLITNQKIQIAEKWMKDIEY